MKIKSKIQLALLLVLSTISSIQAQAGTSTNAGPMNSWRFTYPQFGGYMSTILLTNGKVLILGGDGGTENYGYSSPDPEVFDPVTGTWTNAPMTIGITNYYSDNVREMYTTTILPNGKVLVAGGWFNEPNGPYYFYSSCELFDPTGNTWTNTGSLNIARSAHTATLLPNGKVLVAGGFGPNIPNLAALTSVELYDPVTGLWTTNGNLLTGRYGSTATLLPNGKVLFAGGSDVDSEPLSSAEIYDPGTGTATAIILNNVAKLSSGAFQIGFSNAPGANFTALATTNLSLPLSNWTTLGSVTQISSGQYQYTDSQATNLPKRFYRVSSP